MEGLQKLTTVESLQIQRRVAQSGGFQGRLDMRPAPAGGSDGVASAGVATMGVRLASARPDVAAQAVQPAPDGAATQHGSVVAQQAASGAATVLPTNHASSSTAQKR